MEATVHNRYGDSPATAGSIARDVQCSAAEKRILRWGGVAGMLGGVLFLAVFVFVGAIVGADPAGPEGPISRFPEIRAARTIENALYLAVLMLWTAHGLVLYRALRKVSPAHAIIGSALSLMGLVVLAAGALPHAATVSIADLYHAPGASAQDQAGLIMAWRAMQAIFNALLVTGLVLLPFGVVGLGVAMWQAPTFGKGYGWAGVILGVVGAGAAVALLVDPQSFIAVVGFFALIAFHLVVGWKVNRLSRA